MTNKSDLIISEVRRRKSQGEVVDVDEEVVKLVTFTLRDEVYAFLGEDIREILPCDNITFVPGSPDFILGIINVRGDIESVINLHKLTGLPIGKTTGQSRIAIGEKEGIRSGILVDSIEDVADIPKTAIKPPVSTINSSIREFVAGEILMGDKSVTILDLCKIFRKIAA